VKNEKILEASRLIADSMIYYLSYKNGMYQCNQEEEQYENENSMIQYLKSLNLCSEDDFPIAYNLSIIAEDENIIKEGGFLRSTQTIFPLKCAIKNKILEFKWHLLGLALFIGIILAGINKKHEADREAKYVIQIVDKVHQMLQEQAKDFQEDKRTGEYIATLHIRDTLLKPPINTAKRDRLWKKVEDIIKNDARIQEQTTLVHGEQSTVWQWIAPIRFQRSYESSI